MSDATRTIINRTPLGMQKPRKCDVQICDTFDDGTAEFSIAHHGQVFTVIVDSEDVPKLMGPRWSITKRREGRYCIVRSRNGIRQKLHRLIAGTRIGELTDHKNGNVFDNRKSNLRTCGAHGSSANRSGWSKLHPYKGIFQKQNHFCAELECNGHRRRLQGFSTRIEAARAYDRMAVESFGQFACVNFPEDFPHLQLRCSRKIA